LPQLLPHLDRTRRVRIESRHVASNIQRQFGTLLRSQLEVGFRILLLLQGQLSSIHVVGKPVVLRRVPVQRLLCSRDGQALH
jgi:hypothetical protein